MISLLRTRHQSDSGKVTMVELFFDLVFVFAITQLSHTLLADPSPRAAVQVLLMMLAVWWAWIYTSWVTNWLDPERLPVRLALFAWMLAGLVISSALPKAFGDRGLAFAIAYVALQVGRTVFVLWALRDADRKLLRNFQRILVWLLLSAIVWIIGGLAEADERLAWWLLALGIELVSPIVLFWVPGLGRSSTADWNINADHMAERCALFVILALGESILVTGATFANLAWTATTVGSFLLGVLGSITLWWIYFDTGATRAHHRMRASADPGRQARVAYTYLHLPIVAGIIVCAVADELVLAHPDHLSGAATAAILGGPALYLLGNAMFKWVSNDRRLPPLSHLAGLVLLALLLLPLALVHAVSALGLTLLVNTVLLGVAIWESIAVRRADPAGGHGAGAAQH